MADIESLRPRNHELAALLGAVALAGKLVKKVVMPASRIATPISMVA